MNYQKDTRWIELSNDRQRELLPVIFKKSIKNPKVYLPIVAQVLLVVALLAFASEYQYSLFVNFCIILITAKLAFIPMKNEQYKIFVNIIESGNK